jgi:hypothetical protein
VDKGCGPADIDSKMTYITTMFAFDLAMRAGEAVHIGRGGRGSHDKVLHQTVMVIQKGVNRHSVRGGIDTVRDLVFPDNVRMIEICALTHKSGVINTTKEIKRDSEEEEEFLEDLARFMKQSGATNKEPLFSRRAPAANGVIRLKVCRPRMVTEAIKAEVTRQGLGPTLFSFHSLMHIKALGVSREETLAMGNYSKASVMIDTTYNYNLSGTGPMQ